MHLVCCDGLYKTQIAIFIVFLNDVSKVIKILFRAFFRNDTKPPLGTVSLICPLVTKNGSFYYFIFFFEFLVFIKFSFIFVQFLITGGREVRLRNLDNFAVLLIFGFNFLLVIKISILLQHFDQ